MPATSVKNAALGCLLGAAVGDAAGAVLEFQAGITSEEAKVAMTMPGGGCWSVGPGQFTDDTELALSLAHGLCHHDPAAGFPAQSVAERYSAWYHSRPFDIGSTCSAAFRTGSDPKRMQEAANSHSMSNGALMRSTPLAIWAHRLNDDAAIAALAAADAQLSHPNQACQDANSAYVIAAAHLIRQPGDAEGAVARAEAWARAHAAPQVQQWLLQDSRAGDVRAVVDATQSIGFVKHAFTLAFWHLRHRSEFGAGLHATLLAGGDTDTNAAIVCGLLGALWGAAAIPPAMAQPVLQYKYPAEGRYPGHSRPEELAGARIPGLVEDLL